MVDSCMCVCVHMFVQAERERGRENTNTRALDNCALWKSNNNHKYRPSLSTWFTSRSLVPETHYVNWAGLELASCFYLQTTGIRDVSLYLALLLFLRGRVLLYSHSGLDLTIYPSKVGSKLVSILAASWTTGLQGLFSLLAILLCRTGLTDMCYSSWLHVGSRESQTNCVIIS